MFRTHTATNWKLLLPLSLLMLLGIFWLPYHVPTPPSVSDSYIFGFNNRVAWLFFISYVALFFVFGPRVLQPESDGGTLSKSALYKALAGTFLTTLLMYLLVRPLAGFGEADYLSDRIRLTLAGRLPYRQFEYPYGAAFLYAPVSLVRTFHLDVRDAYGIFYILICLLGTYLLWMSLRWIDGSLRAKRSTFLFIWAASLISTLNYGLNYSLLRFIFPVFWVLLVHRTALRKGLGSPAPLIVTVLGYAIMLLISPELAVALAAGSLLYLVLLGRLRSVRDIVAWGLTAAVLIALSGLALKLGVFRTMLAIRVGALNFPVIPALHIGLFLVAAAVTACVAGTGWRSGRKGTALPLVCYALPASAAALGRCDAGHVLLNGLPLFLCGIIALNGTRLPGRSFLWLMWFTYLLPVMLHAPSTLKFFRRSALPAVLSWEPRDRLTRFDLWVLRHKERENGPERGAADFAAARAAAHGPLAPNFAQIFDQPPGTIFQVPYGFEINSYGRYQSPALEPGYFLAMAIVGTPQQVQAKMNELREHPERPLLLPPGAELPCLVDAALERHVLSHLFVFPYHARAVHLNSVTAPLCTYMQEHYRRATLPDAAHLHYVLWKPKR